LRLFAHVAVFLFTSIVWGLLLLLLVLIAKTSHIENPFQPYPKTVHSIFRNAKLFTCGNTTEEAKRAGCQYDILSNHWIPSLCMDQGAIEEYQTDGTWFGFADEGRTELLTIDAMGDLDFYYTSERDHIVHCAMLWRKQFRAFMEGRRFFDTIIADERHTIHCSQFLIDMTENGPDYWNRPIVTHVGHAGCLLRE
jgi:hypothetical protein